MFLLQVTYGKQETDLGMFYTVPVTVADKVSLRAKVLTEKYEYSILVFCLTFSKIQFVQSIDVL